jgi:magnesium-transporting ATPase (P-type)
MLLDTGDKVIADGYTIDVRGLVVDEASLTGESDPIKKGPPEDDLDPWVRSGTQVWAWMGSQCLETSDQWQRLLLVYMYLMHCFWIAAFIWST